MGINIGKIGAPRPRPDKFVDITSGELSFEAGLEAIEDMGRELEIGAIPDGRLADFATRLIASYCNHIQDPLRIYKPLPMAEMFHRSCARKRLASGSVRAAKTLTASIEIARIVRGMDPYAEGKGMPRENGAIICVGSDNDHIGQTMWKKLAWPGAFDMIRDRDTGLWRAVRTMPGNPRVLDPDDLARKKEWRPAGPLIPPSCIKSIAWEDKARYVPRVVTLKNGWQMFWHTSGGNIRKGIAVNCLAGSSMVYDPVLREMRRIDKIDSDWHVLSWNESTRSVEIRPASKPFIKGHGKIYRFRLSNGEFIETTLEHKVLAADGAWVTMKEALETSLALLPVSPSASEIRALSDRAAQTPETFLDAWRSELYSLRNRGRRPAGPSWREAPWLTNAPGCALGCGLSELSAQGLPESCSACRRPCGERLRSPAVACQGPATSQDGAPESSPASCCQGGQASTASHSQPCRGGGASVAASFSQALGPSLSAAHLLPQEPSARSCSLPQAHAASRPATSLDRHTCDAQPRGQDRDGAWQSPAGGSEVYVLSHEEIGVQPIWDIYVPRTNSYIYGNISNHNCVWYDEEIENETWLPESLSRLLDRDGMFMWSAVGQAGTRQMLELHYMAQAGTPGIEEFRFLIEDNPYISDKVKKEFYDSLNPEDRAVRYYGEYAIAGRKIYPEFDPSTRVHGVDPFPIPYDWMRGFALDPGTQAAGVLFFAIPPDGSELHFYDEIMASRLHANDLALEIKKRTEGYQWEIFIIDQQGGKQTPYGYTDNAATHYSKSLQDAGIVSRLTGSGFAWGSNDIEARTMSMKRFLRTGEDGKPVLRVHSAQCPNLCRQMSNQFYRKDRPNERDKRLQSDIVDPAEYIAAHFDTVGMYYHPPTAGSVIPDTNPAYEAFIRSNKKSGAYSEGVSLGPVAGW